MYVLFDNEIEGKSRSSVGGKASAIARLRSIGLPVPPFFVVTAEAARHHIAGSPSLTSQLESITPHSKDGSALAAIRSIRLARDLLDEVNTALSTLLRSTPDAPKLVAVRSSAAQEDSAQASFAGQFASLLGVEPRLIEDAIKGCWASYFSQRASRYRAAKSDGRETYDLAVIVQHQLFPDKAGVLFTRHPLFPDDGSKCHIEANFGSGESVVAGVVTPDSYTCEWPTGRLLERRINSKQRMSMVQADGGTAMIETPAVQRGTAVLDDQELNLLVGLASEIEQLFGSPQDIEWAIVGRQAWIVQSRPITRNRQAELA